MKRPFVVIGSSMFISLFIYSQLGFPSAMVFFVLGAVFSLPSFLLRRRFKHCRAVVCICIAVLISSVLFSAKTVHEYYPAMSLCDEKEHTISGTLYEYKKSFGKHYYILDNVCIDDIQTMQQIRVNSEVYIQAETDDILTFSEAFVYSIGSSRHASLNHKADNIYLGGYSSEEISVVRTEKHSVKYFFQSIRNYISETLNENLQNESAAVINALLTGDDSEADSDTLLDFRYSGVAHLFAVSGFHLALWTSMLSFLFSKIFRKHKIFAVVASIAFVIFFMALTGFTKSVVRAGIMILIMLFGKIIRHKADSLNSLFMAVTIILTVNPFAVTSLSLQMSFLATLGIVVLADPVTEPVTALKWKFPKLLYYIIATVYTTVAISVIASIFTMPVSALNFGYYSPIAPVTNVLCLPASQILMPLSGIAIILSPIIFLAKPLFLLCDILSKYLISVTSVIGHFPYAVTDTDTTAVQIAVLIILFTTAVFLIIFKDNNKALRICIAVSSAVVLMFSAVTEIIQRNSYEISVADVDNGTSIILRTGKADAVIACGGNEFNYYKLTNMADNVNEREFDLLVIPRNSETESLYAKDILNTYIFRSCIIADEDFPKNLIQNFPENTTKTSETTVMLDENTTLIYINNERFSGVRIEAQKFSSTILFRAASDFSAVPENWKRGDLLVVRQSLPSINLTEFENIIVSGSVSYDNEKISSTEKNNNIRYIKFPWGGVSVNADL